MASHAGGDHQLLQQGLGHLRPEFLSASQVAVVEDEAGQPGAGGEDELEAAVIHPLDRDQAEAPQARPDLLQQSGEAAGPPGAAVNLQLCQPAESFQRLQGGTALGVVDEEHLLYVGTHSAHHLHLPALVEEVGRAGQEVPDVEHGILHLLQIVNPAEGISQEVRPDKMFESRQSHDNPGLPLVTDVGPTDVKLLQTLTVCDQPHRFILQILIYVDSIIDFIIDIC